LQGFWLEVEVAGIIVHEADEPNAVVDLLDAWSLTSQHGGDVDSLAMQAEAVLSSGNATFRLPAFLQNDFDGVANERRRNAQPLLLHIGVQHSRFERDAKETQGFGVKSACVDVRPGARPAAISLRKSSRGDRSAENGDRPNSTSHRSTA
jgi:hypothetical protein